MNSVLDLIKIYGEIEIIYSKLYELDIKGKRNSRSFIRLVNMLKNNIEKEEMIFEDILTSPDYDKIVKFIFRGNTFAFSRMRDYIENFERIYNVSEYENGEYGHDLLVKFGKLANMVMDNVYLLAVSFMDDIIDKMDNRELRNRIINLKYYNSSVKHSMENSIIGYNFNVPKENYVDVYFAADCLKIDFDTSSAAILTNYSSIINSLISQLLMLNDNDMKDNNKLSALIFYSCMIRACVVSLSEEEFNEISDNIYGLIDECSNDNNEKIVSVLNDIINNRQEYKSRVMKISMRPLKI